MYSPWEITQKAPIPNFTDMKQYLGMEKMGKTWSGDLGEVDRYVGRQIITRDGHYRDTS